MWISKVCSHQLYVVEFWPIFFFRLDKYFRIGHMGISVVDPQRGDINTVIKSLEEALEEVKEEKANQH